MKDYGYIIAVSVVLFASGLFLHQRKLIRDYKNLYNKELQNVEAYRIDNSGLKDDARQYQMTIDDLKSSNDSIDKKLVEMAEELKIKSNKIQYMQYQTKTIYKTDTLQLKDTLFLPKAHLDTLIGDKWYSLRLKLDYPSTVVASPVFNSEQYVIINTEKEYNKKPSKWFFIRWFQKKHTVVKINVRENSPYVTSKEKKFIKIIE